MIIRMWRGPVPKAKRAAYIDYLKKTGHDDYARTPGCKGGNSSAATSATRSSS